MTNKKINGKILKTKNVGSWFKKISFGYKIKAASLILTLISVIVSILTPFIVNTINPNTTVKELKYKEKKEVYINIKKNYNFSFNKDSILNEYRSKILTKYYFAKTDNEINCIAFNSPSTCNINEWLRYAISKDQYLFFKEIFDKKLASFEDSIKDMSLESNIRNNILELIKQDISLDSNNYIPCKEDFKLNGATACGYNLKEYILNKNGNYILIFKNEEKIRDLLDNDLQNTLK